MSDGQSVESFDTIFCSFNFYFYFAFPYQVPRLTMPLLNVPSSINAELLYALARMGHGDYLVIADANFPSDSVAASCIHKTPIRVSGKTVDILRDILKLFPLDQYVLKPVGVMDRVQTDKDRNLLVPTYDDVVRVCSFPNADKVEFIERFAFYERAKKAFVIVQTDDKSLYANIIVTKGVI